MIRMAVVGLGKMGISHLAIVKAHPEIQVAAVCDAADYVLDVLNKYTGVKGYSDYAKMLAEVPLDAVLIATPSRFHGPMVRAALEKGLHVFCEKPFCLDAELGLELAALARSKNLVNQVGYHYRFVGAFREAKRIVESGVLGRIHHVRAEAYGPVVLRPKNTTWRAKKTEGGGCLYDYASHAIDLVTYIFGAPQRVGGTVLNRVFSGDVDDEVYASLFFSDGATGQLAVNWSDESFRKMSTKISVWGTKGRLAADRQEVQVYLRDADGQEQAQKGWNIHYTTELTENLWYYLRGEEYSAQIDHFVTCIREGKQAISNFASASETDHVVRMLQADAAQTQILTQTAPAQPDAAREGTLKGKLQGLFSRG